MTDVTDMTDIDHRTVVAAQLDAMGEDEVRALDRAHVFHSWSAQGLIDPMPIAGAQGCTSGTTTGNR